MPRDLLIGVIASVGFHSAVLLGGGILFLRPAQYGMEQGSGGLEIALVAAPPRGIPALPRPPEPTVKSSENDFVQPEVQSSRPVEAGRPIVSKGDGSSRIPGRDPTTFYSEGGGQTEAKPNYLRNPAPAYPRAARLLGQEGRVVLSIAVDKAGRPTRVEVEKSSGYPTLDDSARKTVRRWQFIPARAAGVTVDSVAKLTIRFKLEEKEEALG